MDRSRCFWVFLLNCIIFINSSPIDENINLKSLIHGNNVNGKNCDFPPMFLATEEPYSSQFQACSSKQPNAVMKQMCSELEMESMCYLTTDSPNFKGSVSLPISNITKGLFSGSDTDRPSYVTQLCQYLNTFPWTQEECARECTLGFFICDLYVVMDKVLRGFFECGRIYYKVFFQELVVSDFFNFASWTQDAKILLWTQCSRECAFLNACFFLIESPVMLR